VTLKGLLLLAWHLDDFQVASKFDLEHDRFDLAARIPASATEEQFEAMLRNLLAERFHLRAHVESRDFDAFALEIAKGGAKLVGPAGKSEPIPRVWLEQGFPQIAADRPALTSQQSVSGGVELLRTRGQQQSLASLASTVQRSAGLPVVDRTGLSGLFDFNLEFAIDTPLVPPTEAVAPPAASLNTALQRQLGLQLVKRKLPFDVVVVDSVERFPTGN
jgi:uncharacterized protein (TIGR03435 family)